MLVLDLRGATINTMVLAGFVIAVGVVVDDAIIDVENIVRRLRQARARRAARSRPRAIILDASIEVRSAIVYATLIDVVGGRAGVLHRGAVRRVLPAAGAVLRAGGAGVDGRGADRHAGHVPAPAVAAGSSSAASRRSCACCKRGYGALLRADRPAAAPGRIAAVGVCCWPGSSSVPRSGQRCSRTSRSATS